MITINYQMFGNKGFQLRLRLYQEGETKFINVTKLLKGSIQKRHWNQKKQLFIPSCPFSDENNAMLVQFRQKYDEMAIKWTGSVFGMVAAMNEAPSDTNKVITLSGYIKSVVENVKKRTHSDGTIKGTFEVYEKLDRRLAEYCKAKKIKYGSLLLTDLTPSFVDNLFEAQLGMIYLLSVFVSTDVQALDRHPFAVLQSELVPIFQSMKEV